MEPDKIRNCSIEYTTGEAVLLRKRCDELDEEVGESFPRRKRPRHKLENFHGTSEALLLKA